MAEMADKSGTVKAAHKGFDRWWDAMQLQLQMYARIAALVLLVQGLVVSGLCLAFSNATQRSVTFAYYYAKASRALYSNPTVNFVVGEEDYSLPAREIVKAPRIKSVASGQTAKVISIWLASCLLWLAVPVAARFFKRKAEKEMAVEHIRGPQLLTSEQLTAEILEDEKHRADEAKRRGEPATPDPRFHVGGIPIQIRIETKHMGVFGTTGMGKSTLSYQLLNEMRGSKAIILDVAGEYISKFYDPSRGDKIFNILDERGVRWNIFNEFKTPLDVEAFWHALVPDVKAGGNEQFFNDAARAVGIGATHVCIQEGTRTPEALAELIFSNTEVLEQKMSKCSAAARGHVFIQQPNSNLAGSVMAVLMQYAGWLELLPAGPGDWGLTDWINDGEPGFLFLSTKKDVAKILQPALSLFVDLSARRILSLPEDKDRRIFFLLDEFGALNRMNMFHSFLTEGRKKGVVIILLVQEISQIKGIYGEDVTHTILNNLGSIVTFNLGDAFTAESLEKRFGKNEYWETKENHVLGVEAKASITQSKDKRKEELILASEIQSLKELEFFIRVPNFNPAKGKLTFLPVNNTPATRPDFILRNGIGFENTETVADNAPADDDGTPLTTAGGLRVNAVAREKAAALAETEVAIFETEPQEEPEKVAGKEDPTLTQIAAATFDIDEPSF